MTQKEQNILETCMACCYDMLAGNWDGMMANLAASHHKRLSVNLTLNITDFVNPDHLVTIHPQISYHTRAFSSASPARSVDPHQSEFRFTAGLISSPESHQNRIRRITAV